MRLMLGVFSFCLAVASWAQQATISLDDGSVLRGEVVGLSNGFYSLRGNSFGELKIPKNNVRSIEYGDTSASPAGPGLSQLQAIQARLLMDPNLLDSIQSLGSDPLVRDIVNDPEIKRAIESGDYPSLMINPKIIQLMQHETIRSITEQVH